MRRLTRRLFTPCSSLSLLLCVVCVLLAVLVLREPTPYMPGYTVFQPLGPERTFTAADIDAYPAPPPTIDFAGFRVQRAFQFRYQLRDGRLYTIPYWFLAVAWAALPSLWLRRRRRQARAARRLLAGRCGRCGYDVRASPERCPECGAATTSPA